MNRIISRVVGGIVAPTLLVALSGCGILVVDNPDGVGTCGDPATITTSQNAAGDELTVTYHGTDSAALFYVQSFFAQDFAAPGESLVWGMGNNGDISLYRLDPTGSGWTTSGSGQNYSATFTGSVQEMVGNQPLTWERFYGAGGELADAIMPGTVLIDCDGTHTTQDVTAGGGSGWTDVFTDWTFTAGQPVYPNSIRLDPFRVISTEPTPTGANVTLAYADSAYDVFGSFQPAPPQQFSVISDDPNLPNDNISDLWAQMLFGEISGTGYTMSITSTNSDGSVNAAFSSDDGTTPPAGNYILFSLIPNLDSTAVRVVFSSFVFDENNRVLFDNPFTPENEAVATLADTGAKGVVPVALGVSGGLMLALGVAMVIVRLRRRGTSETAESD